MTISFTVPAIPVAQPRQRHAMIAGHVRNYMPSKHPVNAFKACCRLAFQQAYDGPPLKGPLILQIAFIMPRPSNLIWKKRPMPRREHTKKPDMDNLYKSTVDALTGLAFVDDSQICEVLASKSIAAGDEQPHVWISISQIPEITGAP